VADLAGINDNWVSAPFEQGGLESGRCFGTQIRIKNERVFSYEFRQRSLSLRSF